MKFIDILVRDLHKFGGWPEGAVECHRFVDEANIDFYDVNGKWDDDCFLKYGAFAQEAVREQGIVCESESITREQYDAALAAAQPQWNGDGLPPVGCEFEYSFHADNFSTWHWRRCTATGRHGILSVDKNDTELYLNDTNNKFRPIRSEANKKRDEVMCALINYTLRGDASDIYDAIAAGKIPHVHIE